MAESEIFFRSNRSRIDEATICGFFLHNKKQLWHLDTFRSKPLKKCLTEFWLFFQRKGKAKVLTNGV